MAPQRASATDGIAYTVALASCTP